jgi:heme-degrading monooxygenase HmoA
MYIAMNRFKVQNGSETAFEDVWKNRDSSLSEMKGFREFHLLHGPVNETEGYTLFASHTVWASHEDFVAWTKSENFRAAHRNTGTSKIHYLAIRSSKAFRSSRELEWRSRRCAGRQAAACRIAAAASARSACAAVASGLGDQEKAGCADRFPACQTALRGATGIQGRNPCRGRCQASPHWPRHNRGPPRP